MEFRSRRLAARFLHPGRSYETAESEVEVRWDPLTGYAARLVTSGPALLAPQNFDLEEFGRTSQGTCPFCSEKIERTTPKLLPQISPEGRIRRGRAVLFPNLLTYNKHSAVGVYSPDLHYLPLDKMTTRLVADNLLAHTDFIKAVMRFDDESVWASINANHMLPSGSSLFHPHVQSGVDPEPSTIQQMLAAIPGDRFREYVEAERAAGDRYIGSTGSIDWLTSFAPVGFNEIRAFVPGAVTPAQLEEERVEELARGIANVLNLYAELGFQSFNMALYGAPPANAGYPLNLRIVCRSNLLAPYRSDVTYFERLHWQAMVDTSPERLAAAARSRFS